MGLAIDRERFDPVDYLRFEERLEECLLALGRLVDGPASVPVRSPSALSWSCSWSTAGRAPCR